MAVLVVLAAGCQAIRIPQPVHTVPGEWHYPGGDAGRNAATGTEIAPPLRAAWNYGANAGFGPEGAVVQGGIAFVSNRKGEVHAVRLEDGGRIGLTDFKTAVEGAPAVQGTRMYASLAWGSRTLRAYDLAKGESIWRVKTAPSNVGPMSVGPILVVAAADGSVRGFHAEDGSEAWVLTERRAGQTAPMVASGDGLVYVADEGGRVRAIRASNGRVMFQVSVHRPVYAAPTLVDNRLIVVTTRGTVHVLDASTGAEVWVHDAQRPTLRFTSATVAGGRLFVGGTDGRLRALDGDTGTPLWEVAFAEGISCQPLVTGSTVWIGTMGRDLVAVDVVTGDVRWSQELPGRVKSSLSVHKDGIIALSEPRNVLYFVPAAEAERDHGQ